METIIAAVISGVVALVVCLITQGVTNSRTRALLEYRLDELTKKVDAHNQLVERTYDLEGRADVTDTQIKSLQYQINEVKQHEHQA